MAIFLCLALLFLHFSVLTAAAAPCPPGWLHFAESCYKIEKDALKMWTDAKKSCEDQQSHLVIVMNLEENTFLRSEVLKIEPPQRNLQYWMDGTDLASEGNWTWEQTGDTFEISDWSPHEPNQNAGEEDCLSYLSTNGRWNDEHCDKREGYICEKGESASGTDVVG
ncbi:C-type lectin domain family 17, member A-like [Mya arenaria]|uniref:C-type lectin domain family 17, member A-like n=1 Tax=Mya arenaria TaxID=6604 RepID=UPI0022E1F895|nr:C-type lectin domain family 17, member A-like [Mya arenaria]